MGHGSKVITWGTTDLGLGFALTYIDQPILGGLIFDPNPYIELQVVDEVLNHLNKHECEENSCSSTRPIQQ